MSNVELARFIAGIGWHLACMVVWYQRGNTDRASKSESEFRKLLDSLDELEHAKEVDE